MSISMRQIEIAAEIKKLLSNAQKYVEREKVRLQYFELRLSKLEELHVEFKENDSELQDDASYVKGNLILDFQNWYVQTRDYLTQQKELLLAIESFPENSSIDGGTSKISLKISKWVE